MSGFLKTVFGKATSAAAPSAVKIAETPAALSYTLASFRWHMDTRTPVKVIALHDYLGSCAVWQQMLHTFTADLPLRRYTPSDPLEVYCADLRGHNFSEHAPLTPAAVFPLACAADVLKMQEDVLRSEAPLFGFGFGSLVAACAALHVPEAFSSLTLFVKNLNELLECKPSSYTLAKVIRDAPRNATCLADLNLYLQDKVPSHADRATLLSTVEVHDGACRFRLNKELLDQTETFKLQAPAGRQYTKPTTIFIYKINGNDTPETEATIRARFPNAAIVQVDTEGSVATLDQIPVVPLVLESCGLVGKINDGSEG